MSQNKVVNVVIAGLGGQGVVKASDILADAAFRAGLDVKKSEIHGMAQRGGSVSSDVRFGPQVLSPMVPPGQADYVVVVAADQVDVNRGMAKAEGGVIITPGLIAEDKLANRKSLNVALLGALSWYLAIPTGCWMEAIKAALPEKLHVVNVAAFELGRQAVSPAAV